MAKVRTEDMIKEFDLELISGEERFIDRFLQVIFPDQHWNLLAFLTIILLSEFSY